MTTSINTNTHEKAISLLNFDLVDLKCKIEASFNESSNIINSTLPSNASWDKNEDDLYEERSKHEERQLTIKASINMLSMSDVHQNLCWTTVLNNNIAIDIFKSEINNLENSRDIQQEDLPEGASWNNRQHISSDTIDDTIDELKASIKFLNSIITSTIESFKEVFKGQSPKLLEEITLGKENTKIIFISDDDYCFITIPW